MKKNYNKIYSDEEYMKQGFTKEECELVREHDVIFNSVQDGVATEGQRKRMYELANILGL